MCAPLLRVEVLVSSSWPKDYSHVDGVEVASCLRYVSNFYIFLSHLNGRTDIRNTHVQPPPRNALEEANTRKEKTGMTSHTLIWDTAQTYAGGYKVCSFQRGPFQCWFCRPDDDTPRARDSYDGGDAESTVQFNTEEEAQESEELIVST